MDCSPPRLLCPWNSPGKNTGVGCHSLLQGIFPSQGLNPGLLKPGRFFTICAIREDQVCFTHSPSQLRNPCYSNLSSYTLYHIILGIYNKCCVYRKIWISIKRLNHVELLPEHWVCLLVVLPKDRKAKLQMVLLLTASEENTRDPFQSSVFSEQQAIGTCIFMKGPGQQAESKLQLTEVKRVSKGQDR